MMLSLLLDTRGRRYGWRKQRLLPPEALLESSQVEREAWSLAAKHYFADDDYI